LWSLILSGTILNITWTDPNIKYDCTGCEVEMGMLFSDGYTYLFDQWLKSKYFQLLKSKYDVH
jgi:hypothetical protein